MQAIRRNKCSRGESNGVGYMQAQLLLDMLGKGIESTLIDPSALVDKPWQASGETLNNIDHEAMVVDPTLVLTIQVGSCH